MNVSLLMETRLMKDVEFYLKLVVLLFILLSDVFLCDGKVTNTLKMYGIFVFSHFIIFFLS